jgi:hypothetical protein
MGSPVILFTALTISLLLILKIELTSLKFKMPLSVLITKLLAPFYPEGGAIPLFDTA